MFLCMFAIGARTLGAPRLACYPHGGHGHRDALDQLAPNPWPGCSGKYVEWFLPGEILKQLKIVTGKAGYLIYWNFISQEMTT